MNSDFVSRAASLFGEAVFKVAYSHTKSREAAQDACQDAFVALVEADVVFEDDRHLKCWLIKTAVNKCRNAHKKASGRFEQLTDPSDLAKASVAAPLERDELEVLEAVEGLPPDFRLAVHMHYYEGYSTEEIAKLCGCSHATVRTRLCRARKLLKQKLGETRGQ